MQIDGGMFGVYPEEIISGIAENLCNYRFAEADMSPENTFTGQNFFFQSLHNLNVETVEIEIGRKYADGMPLI